jgi:hypothetical protein
MAKAPVYRGESGFVLLDSNLNKARVSALLRHLGDGTGNLFSVVRGDAEWYAACWHYMAVSHRWPKIRGVVKGRAQLDELIDAGRATTSSYSSLLRTGNAKDRKPDMKYIDILLAQHERALVELNAALTTLEIAQSAEMVAGRSVWDPTAGTQAAPVVGSITAYNRASTAGEADVTLDLPGAFVEKLPHALRVSWALGIDQIRVTHEWVWIGDAYWTYKTVPVRRVSGRHGVDPTGATTQDRDKFERRAKVVVRVFSTTAGAAEICRADLPIDEPLLIPSEGEFSGRLPPARLKQMVKTVWDGGYGPSIKGKFEDYLSTASNGGFSQSGIQAALDAVNAKARTARESLAIAISLQMANPSSEVGSAIRKVAEARYALESCVYLGLPESAWTAQSLRERLVGPLRMWGESELKGALTSWDRNGKSPFTGIVSDARTRAEEFRKAVVKHLENMPSDAEEEMPHIAAMLRILEIEKLTWPK